MLQYPRCEAVMAAYKYRVALTDEERDALRALLRGGKTNARKLARAHILLLADEGKTDEEIAAALHVGDATALRVRQRFVEESLESALSERPRPGAARKLDGEGERTLLALACSDPPEGRAFWSLQLLADRLVELEVVEAISDETVRRVLKRGRSSPG
jgi:transposase